MGWNILSTVVDGPISTRQLLSLLSADGVLHCDSLSNWSDALSAAANPITANVCLVTDCSSCDDVDATSAMDRTSSWCALGIPPCVDICFIWLRVGLSLAIGILISYTMYPGITAKQNVNDSYIPGFMHLKCKVQHLTKYKMLNNAFRPHHGGPFNSYRTCQGNVFVKWEY